MATLLLPADTGAGAAAATCSTFASTDRGSSFIYGSLVSVEVKVSDAARCQWWPGRFGG
jgi:hypothetical protein